MLFWIKIGFIRNNKFPRCPDCKEGLLKRDEKSDRPFDKDTFNGEGIWIAYKCSKCGYIDYDPLD